MPVPHSEKQGLLRVWQRQVSDAINAAPRGLIGHAAVTGAPSNATSAYADVTGCSVTWDADPTRRYRTTLVAQVSVTGASDAPQLRVFTAANSPLGTAAVQNIAANTNTVLTVVPLVESGLSGSTTRKARFGPFAGSGSGGGTMHVSAARLIVEDVGPA